MDQLQIKRLTTQLRQIVGTNVISTMAYNAIDASRIRESVLTVARMLREKNQRFLNC